MTLQTNQIKLYSIDTTDLFIGEEKAIHTQMNNIRKYKSILEGLERKLNKNDVDKVSKLYKGENDVMVDINVYYKLINSKLDELLEGYKDVDEAKDKLSEKLKTTIEWKSNVKSKTFMFKGVKYKFKGIKRTLDEANLTVSKQINQFESAFTRAIGIKTDELTTDVFIVEVFHREVMRQILRDGFTFNNTKYVYAFSSAGQIREKRLVMLNENVYKSISPRLFAGLTDEQINKFESKWFNDETDKDKDVYGMVQGKLIAYKALAASSSLTWEEYKGNDEKFDINEVVVVPDVEFEIKDVKQDHIDLKFKLTKDKVDSIINPYMDGAGVCLPSWNDKNVQVRFPFGKGLIVPFDFLAYAKNEYDIENPMITDAWGKVHDVRKEGIKVILTCSQFKMWKFFKNEGEITGWDKFKKAFVENGSEFSVVADESLDSNDFKDVKLNYQMLQTLHGMEEDEIKHITSNTKSIIETVGLATRVWDREITSKTKILNKKYEELIDAKKEAVQNILGFMGIGINKKRKLPLEKALLLHNELLHDEHVKNLIKEKKDSYVNDAKAGKLSIPNTKRMFVIPDVTVFMDELLGKEIKGSLQNGEVSCKLYDDKIEINLLRSPHLFIEHAVRKNNIKDKPYFITNGIYTSVHDPISKILNFDNDGDELTVMSDKVFIECAKRHTKDLNVITYDLKVGKPVVSDPNNVFVSLNKAFDANIGIISNAISKVFNKDEVTNDELDTVRLLCAKNNAEIDFAKTLWRAKPQDERAKELLSLTDYRKVKSSDVDGNEKVTKVYIKLPHFFRYAKDKKYKSPEKLKVGEENEVEEANDSTMNQISNEFKKGNLTNMSFCKGKFDYTVLLNNVDIKVDDFIVEKYQELISTNKLKLKKQIRESVSGGKLSIIEYIKSELLLLNSNEVEVTDMLVKHLYSINHAHKDILWAAFGESILHNLETNLLTQEAARKCACGEVFKKEGKTIKCHACRKVTVKKKVIKYAACQDCNSTIVQKRSTQKRCAPCQKISEKSTVRVFESRNNESA